MRDYQEEFQAFVQERRPSADYVLPVLAAELVDALRSSDPELLAGWLDLHAPRFVADYLGTANRSLRARQRGEFSRSAFRASGDALSAGDPEARSLFAVEFVVSADEMRRPLGSMTKADHLFVAERHAERSNAALFEAAFHRALAKKIPAGKTTSDVMTEEQYLRLRRTLGTPKTSAA